MPEIISRADALRLGVKRYFTGRQCKHGHVAERHLSTGHCVKCAANWSRDFRERDLDEARKKERVRRKSYDERTGRHRDLTRQRHALNNGHLPPPPEKECPPRPENGKCECCGKEVGTQKLVLEHDHHTGVFRGWTCKLCNVGLGAFGDSMAGVRLAVNYMAKHYLTGRSQRGIQAAKKRMAESPDA